MDIDFRVHIWKPLNFYRNVSLQSISTMENVAVSCKCNYVTHNWMDSTMALYANIWEVALRLSHSKRRGYHPRYANFCRYILFFLYEKYRFYGWVVIKIPPSTAVLVSLKQLDPPFQFSKLRYALVAVVGKI